MLSLVNSDRAKYHLPPVSLDSVSTLAGQAHSNEMAVLGYLDHVNRLGKDPQQRYTEIGGTHTVSENVAMISYLEDYRNASDPSEFKLLREHLFTEEELTRLESRLFNEKPPNDGHRRNILEPKHNKIGIGLSFTFNGKGRSRVSIAQEFVDAYGEYSKLPEKLILGKSFEVSGELYPGLEPYSVSIFREELEGSFGGKEHANSEEKRSSYNALVSSYANDVPRTMRIWSVRGRQHFSVRFTPKEDWKQGSYCVQISARKKGSPFEVSSRTVSLD